MNEKIKQHAPAAALTGVQIAAPLNPHGQCFGLIPAGGDWLDDLIDWSRRQFKRPEDAQRIAASWNALIHVPLAQLMEPAKAQSEALKLRTALADCKASVKQAAVESAGFAATVIALDAALRALKTELAGEFHDFANEQDEEMQAPVQFAMQKVAEAMLLLYGVGIDAGPPAAIVREPYARRATPQAEVAPELQQPVASKYATLPDYSAAMAAWRARRAAAAGSPSVCNVAPRGWHCTRVPGHCGPCAAIPVNASDENTGGAQ